MKVNFQEAMKLLMVWQHVSDRIQGHRFANENWYKQQTFILVQRKLDGRGKKLQTDSSAMNAQLKSFPSTLKCGCQPPLPPCALCTGRADPTAPRDLPDTLPTTERVALLDPGFHPVLSFPDGKCRKIFQGHDEVA